MKPFLMVLAGWFLIGISTSNAQFILVSSEPVDGAVNVPRMTAVSFTFSEPLDTTARYDSGDRNLPISANPNDSIEISAISYSNDLRTITFQVVHHGDSDFAWIIIGARSKNGDQLDHPFALNYTTVSSHGLRSVSGTVAVDGGSTMNVVVVLADGPLIGEREGIARIVGVVSNQTGTYSLGNIRDGVYWPAAAKDGDENGSIDPGLGDPFGQYDPNEDGHPDSIVISGTNRSGIDITLRSISSVPNRLMSMGCLKSPPQIFPNPLNQMAVIRFSLKTPTHVKLCIFNALGHMVGSLLDGICMGQQSVSFDSRDLHDGIYCYRLMVGNECNSGKMIVMH